MQHKIFAFISYSRKDIDVARDIQRRLEKYPYPKDKVAEDRRPYNSDYIRKVFLDITDLSARERKFTDELKQKLSEARYLIVICSKNSATSNFVKKEIEYFCQKHNQQPNLIIPVLVDETRDNIHPIVDEIISRRNCPVYFTTGKKDEHRLDNKYCFYHIVEFLLNVDFNVLFNRYMAYTKSRARKRIIALSVIFSIILLTLGYGFYKKHRLSEFEKKTFPYSLVVGYVNNFMSPLLECMDSTLYKSSFIFLMPKTYDDLDNKKRGMMYFDFIKSHYPIDSISNETYRSPVRKRDLDIMRVNISNCYKAIYIDLVNTVSAFKYVIDYKVNSELYVDQTPNEMVQEYTTEYIQCTYDSLKSRHSNLYFVKDTLELRDVFNKIITE